MLTRIWFRSAGKCVWIGELPFVPREGEYIVFNEDVGSETVRQVSYIMSGPSIEITLEGTDNDNRYPSVDPKFPK